MVIKINRFVHILREVNIIEHKRFCDCLKIWREKAGLTQRELAKALDVQFQTVWRWEHGEREPSLDILKKLCEILGITESELLNGPVKESWELRLVMRKAGDPQKGVMDMAPSGSNAALYMEDDRMAIMLSGDYTLWENDDEFEALIKQLRRKRALGLKSRKEDW